MANRWTRYCAYFQGDKVIGKAPARARDSDGPRALLIRLAQVRRLLATGLDHSRQLLHPSLTPFNLHKSRVRRASGFLLRAFSNTTPLTFFQP
jgi:hypothetical protein